MNSCLAEKTKDLAKRIRLDSIRMAHLAHASHIASALSVADIVAVLYGGVAKIFPEDPKNAARDRIVLSKGHAGMAVYAALAETGFFSRSELNRYCQDGSVYSGHISHKNVPGVEVSTGSLGQGVCMACGMALSGKMRGQSYRVYAIVGDGEIEEGAVWEMALFAAHQKLSNFTVIVDCNRMQAMGFCEEQAGLNNVPARWKAFGWNVVEVKDGNDHVQLIDALGKPSAEAPTVVIAHTVKGKGVSFMENNLLWHYRNPDGEFFEKAIVELGGDPSCEAI